MVWRVEPNGREVRRDRRTRTRTRSGQNRGRSQEARTRSLRLHSHISGFGALWRVRPFHEAPTPRLLTGWQFQKATSVVLFLRDHFRRACVIGSRLLFLAAHVSCRRGRFGLFAAALGSSVTGSLLASSKSKCWSGARVSYLRGGRHVAHRSGQHERLSWCDVVEEVRRREVARVRRGC